MYKEQASGNHLGTLISVVNAKALKSQCRELMPTLNEDNQERYTESPPQAPASNNWLNPIIYKGTACKFT